jgi:hypothetical protein
VRVWRRQPRHVNPLSYLGRNKNNGKKEGIIPNIVDILK